GLSERFRLLANRRRIGPSRHATLRASMDWSYQLLSEDERTALRRLAIFSGRFDLAGAEAVCGFAPIVPTAVLELLSALVDKSLVQPQPLDGFRLLETVRAYGPEHLDRSGETELSGERHVEQFAERCVELEPALWSSHLADALQTVVRDLGNFRSGL